ncbi:iron ABC transporter permease [Paenibacillus sp. NEAU-GSW1]|uniref:FecCD family ABC transporter permease n=1 Tax=Paenibacillus sp. NEAU-GSW1 TaxID=2682486 RepID=UPI0012E1BA5D|nr:iron ABC transporter permease [Paenibacillus sp. NEAU-GSW1]MUT67266.1 iron chelate uptake ABC transporter family permease subunit [Paenibacillus sp. NEAU-GSW1]
MNKYNSIRTRKLSFLVEKKTVAAATALLVLCTVAAVLSTGIGSKFVAPLDVVKSIFGYGNPMHDVIVLKLRLPRIIIALLVGAALASAGTVLQGLIRNPLASPDVTGITEGASLGAVLFIFFFNETLSIHWMPVAAIIGAFAVTFLLYLLSWKNGSSALRMVLIGTGLSAAFKSLSYMFLISGPFYLASRSLTFMTGSIYGASWEKDVYTLLPWLLVLLPLTWLMARHVNVGALGDEVAGSAGANVQLHRLLLLLLSVALAGAAVAIGGAIAFVGLMAPHIARKLVGSSFGGLLPVSALIGGLIVLLSDLAARTLFSPLDIPAGVFTAVIGAPFFLFLLYRNRNQ